MTADDAPVREVPAVPAIAARMFGDRLPAAEAYARLLVSDGIDHGLIGPREAARLWERHLIPSAVPASLLPRGASVADVGSGAGLPGLLLALARPDLTVTLVEPMARRCAFLEEAVACTGTGGRVRVLRARAEELTRLEPGFDVVVARAVARLPRLLAMLLPLCRPGGQVLAIKGAGLDEEVGEAVAVLSGPTVRVWDVVQLALPAGLTGESDVDSGTIVDTATGVDPGTPVDPGTTSERMRTPDVVRVLRAVAADSVPVVRRGRPGTRGRRGGQVSGGTHR